MVAVNSPDYSHIINLDKMVRDSKIPAALNEPFNHDVRPRFLVMQRALVSMGRDIGMLLLVVNILLTAGASAALLQLHRRFFTEAMSGPETFNLQHQYAPSVLATYLGAASIISAVETLFDQEQQLSLRFLHFWFNSFSAAVSSTATALHVHGIDLTPPGHPLTVHISRAVHSSGTVRSARSRTHLPAFPKGRENPTVQRQITCESCPLTPIAILIAA
jgi:hypothetical protein